MKTNSTTKQPQLSANDLVNLYHQLSRDTELTQVFFKPAADLRVLLQKKINDYNEIYDLWAYDPSIRRKYEQFREMSKFFGEREVIDINDYLNKKSDEILQLRHKINTIDQSWGGLTWDLLKIKSQSHQKLGQLVTNVESNPEAFTQIVLSLNYYYELIDAPGFGTPVHLLVLYFLSLDNPEEIEYKASQSILNLFRKIVKQWGRRKFISLLINSHEDAIDSRNSSAYRSCILKIFIEYCENERVHHQTIESIRLGIKALTGIKYTSKPKLEIFDSYRTRYLKDKLKHLKQAQIPLQNKFEKNHMFKRAPDDRVDLIEHSNLSTLTDPLLPKT
jgi:hypothetical protein